MKKLSRRFDAFKVWLGDLMYTFKNTYISFAWQKNWMEIELFLPERAWLGQLTEIYGCITSLP